MVCFGENCDELLGSLKAGNLLSGWHTIRFSRKIQYLGIYMLMLID
jgi:hypothetical protein